MQTQRRIGTISGQIATAKGQTWTMSPWGRTTPSADQASPPWGRHPSSWAGRGSRIFCATNRRASRGCGRLVLLGGEAGIGKTSLARDLIQRRGRPRVRVLAGSCYDLTNTPPYGPWLDLFEGAGATRACPRPPPPSSAAGCAGNRPGRALRRGAAILGRARATVPPSILLEDLHWADPASLDLLRDVAPHLRHWPLLLLATYRVDELTPRHPAHRQLPALVREATGSGSTCAGSTRTPCAPSSRPLSAGATDEDRLVAYLERHAEGNPFFATELLRTLEEDALLRIETRTAGRSATLDRVVVPVPAAPGDRRAVGAARRGDARSRWRSRP